MLWTVLHAGPRPYGDFVSVCKHLCLPATPKGTALELEIAFCADLANAFVSTGWRPKLVGTLNLSTGIIPYR